MEGYIYKLTLLKDVKSRTRSNNSERTLKKDSVYIGQHNGTNRNYFTSGRIPLSLIKIYGKNIFHREVLVSNVSNVDLLNELERHYIRIFNTYKKTSQKGLNLDAGKGVEKEIAPIYQYDKDGNYLQEFAAKRELERAGFNLKSCRTCANPNLIFNKLHKGFQWRNFKTPTIPQVSYNKGFKNIYCFDEYGVQKGKFSDLNEVSNAGFNKEYVRRCLRGALIQHKGYVWGFSERSPFIKPDLRENPIPVHKYSLFGEYISSYTSIKDASLTIGNKVCISQTIWRACLKKIKFAYGFIWSYTLEPRLSMDIKPDVRRKKVLRLDKDLNEIECYFSLRDASSITNIDRKSIKYVCEGKYKQAGGSVWRYI